MRNGFWHGPTLSKAVQEWQELFEAQKPALVITEFAPTALLAASLSGLPRADLGTGFTVPPARNPMPSMQPWLEIPAKRLIASDRRLTKVLNETLGTSFKSTADFYLGVGRLCCTFPEMDHYGDASREHLGPIWYHPKGRVPKWPRADGPKLFLYMNQENRFLGPLLRALEELEWNALACIPGAPTTERGSLSVVGELVDLELACQECDYAVTHGGFGTTTALLLAGKPLLLCPNSLEQMMMAFRLNKQGLTRLVSFVNPKPNLVLKIQQLAEDAELRRSAREFSKLYQDYESSQALGHIEQRIREVLF